MADIRINSLPTTATSTSFDDYVAVDGSGNGTRKLSAYSPTFGGNLTVSGTGTSSFAGTLLQRSSTGVGAIASIGTDTGSYSVLRVQNTGVSGRSFDIGTAGSGDATLGSKLYIYDSTAGATRWTMDSSGNIAQTGNLTVSGNVYGGSNLVLYGTTGATGNVYLRAQGAGYVRVDTGSGFRVESGSLDVTAGSLTVSGTGTSTFTGDVSVTRSTGNPTFNLTNGASGGFPLVQFIDQRVGGNNWNIENGRVLGQLSFYSSDRKSVV